MAKKKDSRGRTRDYGKEYRRDHASPSAKKARARRNRDRARAQSAGRVHKGDSKEVHHPAGSARGKTKIVSRHKNRVLGNKARR